eukprot:CAMPEP_0119008744 /NCGR_PEP_ID=MMETSP1176-20130426/3904_1 /TAXON_ID=265551 /ORGANISM="Synedropsis recta cf, Strain CCMP1620" /LENGTH=139 /DNA_ID=CAMNT_0006961137 /DNA_START=123 /DNA_END=542 /DNA_ORIENTATION=-
MSSYQNSNNSSSSNSNHSNTPHNPNNGGGNNNNNSNSADSKKEDFRRYLEKTNVIDALTKVLVGLYEEPERPPNAIDYIRKYMGAPPNVDVESLKRENDDLRHSVDLLTKQVGALQVTSPAGVATATTPSLNNDPPSSA